MFSCPRCGLVGAIFLLKVGKTDIVIKQRCPRHGGRAFRVPLMHKDQYIDLVRDAVFRCYKCGQEAMVSFMKPSGPWAIIKCSCPVHGRMPVQKIWNPIYAEISQLSTNLAQQQDQLQPVQPQPAQPQPAQPQSTESNSKKFCADCGGPIQDSENYCGTCGAKIE